MWNVGEACHNCQTLREHGETTPGKFSNHRMRVLFQDLLRQAGNPLSESYEIIQAHAGCKKPYLQSQGPVGENEDRLVFEIRSNKDKARFMLAWKRMKDE
jgi:hypothetical protein